MTQFKLTRGRHFYHSEMGKHHFTVENAWHTAPTRGGGPCHRKWERPVECPLISYTKINESILWLTWQPSAMWISWSIIMTTCLRMPQNHWPVAFHVVRHESQWKDVDSSGNHIQWQRWCTGLGVSVSLWQFRLSSLLLFLYLIPPPLKYSKMLDRLIWNQLQWNTFLTSNGPWCLLFYLLFQHPQPIFSIDVNAPGIPTVSEWCWHPEKNCRRG